jgi:hypothetical protein
VIVGLAAAVMLDPVRSLLSFGQINLVLLALVAADLGGLVVRRHCLAGAMIGLAAAVKLIPLTALAALVSPRTSQAYWLGAVLQLGRVGDPEMVLNQSLYGAALRLLPPPLSLLVWLGALAIVVVVWWWSVRRVSADGERFGLAEHRVEVGRGDDRHWPVTEQQLEVVDAALGIGLVRLRHQPRFALRGPAGQQPAIVLEAHRGRQQWRAVEQEWPDPAVRPGQHRNRVGRAVVDRKQGLPELHVRHGPKPR